MRESMKQQNPNAHIPGEDEINRAIRESETLENQRQQNQRAQMTQEEQEIMAAIKASQAEADKQKNQQLSEEEMIAKAIEESKL